MPRDKEIKKILQESIKKNERSLKLLKVDIAYGLQQKDIAKGKLKTTEEEIALIQQTLKFISAAVTKDTEAKEQEIKAGSRLQYLFGRKEILEKGLAATGRLASVFVGTQEYIKFLKGLLIDDNILYEDVDNYVSKIQEEFSKTKEAREKISEEGTGKKSESKKSK